MKQPERLLRENIHEHQLADRRHDENPLISQHTDKFSCTFSWKTGDILDQDIIQFHHTSVNQYPDKKEPVPDKKKNNQGRNNTLKMQYNITKQSPNQG